MHRRPDPLRPRRHQPCRQRRRGGAGDEGDGLLRPGAGARRASPTCCSARRRSRWPAARPTCWRARASSPALAEALDGVTCVCATAMTPRDFGPPTLAPRELFADAGGERRSGSPSSSARERFGLANDDVYRCHACLTHPDRSRLRLAQPGAGGAADRLRLAPGARRLRASRRARADAARWPTRAAVQGAARALAAGAGATIGFLDPAAPKKLMPRLHQLANRAALTAEEVHILRGIARAMRASAAG